MIILSLITVLTITSAVAQQIPKYLELIKSADSLSNSKDLLGAKKQYEEAFSISSGDPQALLSLAKIELRISKGLSPGKSLIKAIENGADLDMLVADSFVNSYFKSNQSLHNQFSTIHNKYLSKIKYLDERTQLLTMLGNDQTLRSLLGTFDFKKVDSLIHNTDTANMSKLKSMISRIGFPDREKVGKDGSDAVFIILMHTLNDGFEDEMDIKHIEPIMKQAVLEGKFPSFFLAILMDRHFGMKKQPQRYGTYWEMDRKSNERRIMQILDVQKVDARRREIGLPSLGYTARTQNLILPEDYNQ